MKFLLSLSLIPLLLLTNVSAAEELQPTQEEESPTVYEYTTVDGYPLLAIFVGEPSSGYSLKDNINYIIQDRAEELCESFGHKEATTVLQQDLQYYFEGKAYFEGHIVDITANLWNYINWKKHSSAIFKVLRCAD